MDLVGFFNRGSEYPNLLMPIGREGTRFYAFYPSGDVVFLKGAVSQADLERRATFVAKPEGVSEVPRLAFAFAANDIVSGDIKSVKANLRQRVRQLEEGSDPEVVTQAVLMGLSHPPGLRKTYKKIPDAKPAKA